MRRHTTTIAVAVVIAVVMLLYMTGFQVRETDIAVVTTFEKPTRVVDTPGLRWKWPRPVQSVYMLDGRLHVFEGTFEELLTKDKRNLLVTACVGWRISRTKDSQGKAGALRFLERVGTLDPEDQIRKAEEFLEARVRNVKTGLIGRYDLKDFISIEETRFDEVERGLIEPIRKKALEELGVEVALVRIKRMALPQEVTAQVFSRMKQEREQEADAYRGEGIGEAQQIQADADAARTKILARAESDAQRIRAEGEAEAAKYLAVLARNPKLHLFLRMVDTLEKVKQRTTYLVDPAVTPPWTLLGPSTTEGVSVQAPKVLANPGASVENQ